MAKKQKCPEFENHERWLVSYADMVTLLFAVFVVLYAIEISKKKDLMENLAQSMQRSFDTPVSDLSVNGPFGQSPLGLGSEENVAGNQAKPNVTPRNPDGTRRISAGMSRLRAVIASDIFRIRYNLPSASETMRSASVTSDARGEKLTLVSAHYFEPGKFTIDHRSYVELEAIGQVLKELGVHFRIEGHADSAVASSGLTNMELSALRAGSIYEFFRRQVGIAPGLMSIAGYGDTRPVRHDNSELSRQMSRRVEIVIGTEGP